MFDFGVGLFYLLAAGVQDNVGILSCRSVVLGFYLDYLYGGMGEVMSMGEIWVGFR